LWPLIEEHHSCTVDNVGLHLRTIKQPLDVVQANYIVINISPDLQNAMPVMAAHAMLADSAIAINTEHIPLVLFRRSMLCARYKKTSRSKVPATRLVSAALTNHIPP